MTDSRPRVRGKRHSTDAVTELEHAVQAAAECVQAAQLCPEAMPELAVEVREGRHVDGVVQQGLVTGPLPAADQLASPHHRNEDIRFMPDDRWYGGGHPVGGLEPREYDRGERDGLDEKNGRDEDGEHDQLADSLLAGSRARQRASQLWPQLGHQDGWAAGSISMFMPD